MNTGYSVDIRHERRFIRKIFASAISNAILGRQSKPLEPLRN